jgi:hypothetical protein
MLDYFVIGAAHADADASQLLWNQCCGNLAIRLASDLVPVVRLLTGWWAEPIRSGTRMKQGHPVVNRLRRSRMYQDSVKATSSSIVNVLWVSNLAAAS